MYVLASSALPPNSMSGPSEADSLRRNTSLARTDDAIRRAKEAHDCVRDLVLKQPKPYATSVSPLTLYSGQARQESQLYGGSPHTAMLYPNLPTNSTGGLVDLSSGIVSTRKAVQTEARTAAANRLFPNLTAEQRREIAEAPEVVSQYALPKCIEKPKPPSPPRYDHPTWGNATAAFPAASPGTAGLTQWAREHPMLAFLLVVGGAFGLGSVMER